MLTALLSSNEALIAECDYILSVVPPADAHSTVLRTRESYPALGNRVEKGLVGVPPKACRWVDEMRGIARTMQGRRMTGSVFRDIAKVYEFVEEGG